MMRKEWVVWWQSLIRSTRSKLYLNYCKILIIIVTFWFALALTTSRSCRHYLEMCYQPFYRWWSHLPRLIFLITPKLKFHPLRLFHDFSSWRTTHALWRIWLIVQEGFWKLKRRTVFLWITLWTIYHLKNEIFGCIDYIFYFVPKNQNLYSFVCMIMVLKRIWQNPAWCFFILIWAMHSWFICGLSFRHFVPYIYQICIFKID